MISIMSSQVKSHQIKTCQLPALSRDVDVSQLLRLGIRGPRLPLLPALDALLLVDGAACGGKELSTGRVLSSSSNVTASPTVRRATHYKDDGGRKINLKDVWTTIICDSPSASSTRSTYCTCKWFCALTLPVFITLRDSLMPDTERRLSRCLLRLKSGSAPAATT